VVVKSSEMLCWCCFGSCCCLLRCSDEVLDDLRFLVSVDGWMSLRGAGGGIDSRNRPRVPVLEADVSVARLRLRLDFGLIADDKGEVRL